MFASVSGNVHRDSPKSPLWCPFMLGAVNTARAQNEYSFATPHYYGLFATVVQKTNITVQSAAVRHRRFVRWRYRGAALSPPNILLRGRIRKFDKYCFELDIPTYFDKYILIRSCDESIYDLQTFVIILCQKSKKIILILYQFFFYPYEYNLDLMCCYLLM